MAENQLIESLPRKDRLGLLEICEPIELVLSQVLGEPGRATGHVYFPVDGFVSLVRTVDGRLGLEVGMVGREGVLGAQLALGVSTSPLHALVQGAGTSRRVKAKAFRSQLEVSAPLRRSIQRYVYVLMEQMATSAACLRYHLINQRLARWLLMSHDRAHADSFYVTQEFLAYMLGVRRVSVTRAAGGLQRDGAIAYQRGRVTVLDRARLEGAACSCYRIDRKSYSDVL